MELTIGKRYIAKYNGDFITVTLLAIEKMDGWKGNVSGHTYRATTRYLVRNEKTGRELRFKSKGKILREALPD